MEEHSTSLYERQWNEARAIQAIYPDEFEEVKPAWNIPSHPPHFVLHLVSVDRTLAVDVSFQLPARYPIDLPIIAISRRKGLLTAQLNELHSALEGLAKKCVGREMIFDIAELAKESLNAFGQKKVSFHDQMLQDRQQKAMLAAEAETAALRKDAELERRIMEELERKQKISEICSRASARSSLSPPGKTIIFDPELIFYEAGLDFAKYIDHVDVTKHLGRQSMYNDEAFACDEYIIAFDGNDLILRQFDLQKLARDDGERFDRRIEGFLRRVNDVALLTHNPYIIRVIGCQCTPENRLDILYEKSNSRPLLECLPSVSSIQGDIKSIYKQLATGLDHIHQSNYIHKDLRIATLYFDKDKSLMQIGDCHLSHELHCLFHKEDLPTPSSWLPPELKERPISVTRKTDVWFLGIVFIQLLFGIDVIDRHANWQSVKSSLGLQSTLLTDLLDNIFLYPSSNYRLTAGDILRHEYFVGDDAGKDNMGAEQNSAGGIRKGGFLKSSSTSSAASHQRVSSRFETDFEQLEVLGRGGFGEVVKARNRVDNRFYAIKKINLDPENVDYNRKILREVMTLSRLQHDRVVRYYQAWTEGAMITNVQSPFGAIPENTGNGIQNNGDKDELGKSDEEESDFEEMNSSRDWLGDSLVDNYNKEDQSVDLSLLKLNTHTGFSESEESLLLSSSSPDITSSEPFEETVEPLVYQILYIQMEYCPKRTLRDLIDEGISSDDEKWRLFRQIVEGLSYIHSQGMIHRDLKPSNIFMDYQGNVKIGDFGLATSTTASHWAASRQRRGGSLNLHQNTSSSVNESLTAGIGTPFYTSPEQEQNSRYSHKVDMYSLGIILLEIWCHFETAMERAECLRTARSSSILLPVVFKSGEYERQRSILLNLLSHEPKQRLSSSDLLNSEWLPVRIENEQINGVLRSVTKPVNPSFSTLLELLFQNAADTLKDFAFDFNSSNVYEVEVLAKMAVVKERMLRVFLNHGAIDVSIPLFQLSTSQTPIADSFMVIDATGQRLDLPFDLTTPFARFIARNGITDFRRFAFERIFRKSVLPGGQPKQPIECDFDIIFGGGDGLVEESEVIKVAVDAIQAACDCSQKQITIMLGSPDLGRLIAQSLSIDGDKFVKSLSSIQHYFSSQKRLHALSAVFPSISAERMSKLIQGDFKSRQAALIECLGAGRYGKSAQQVMAHLLSLMELLKGPLDMEHVNVVIDPLFVHNVSTYCSGICFEVLLMSQHFGNAGRSGKRKRTVEVLAAGGRYDQLISSFKYPSAYGTFTGGVGVAFSVNKLAGFLGAESSSATKVFLWRHSNEVNLEEVFAIASLLWSHFIGCRVIGEGGDARLEGLTALARQNGVKHILVFSGKRSSSYKVRDVDRMIDMEVPRSDVLHHFQTCYSQSSTSNPSATASSFTSSSLSSSSSNDYNIVILGSLGNRLHGTQRAVITEKAVRAVSSLHLSSPAPLSIIVHDVSRELVRRVFEYEAVNESGDTVERLKSLKDKARDAMEPIVFSYSHKENVVDVVVVR